MGYNFWYNIVDFTFQWLVTVIGMYFVYKYITLDEVSFMQNAILSALVVYVFGFLLKGN